MRKLKLFLIRIVIATSGIAQGQSPDKENAETGVRLPFTKFFTLSLTK